MKKWIESLLLPVKMIVGFAILCLGISTVLLVVVYAVVELSIRTAGEPSWWIVLADIGVVSSVIFLVTRITRKKLREEILELWKQIFWNM